MTPRKQARSSDAFYDLVSEATRHESLLQYPTGLKGQTCSLW